MRRLKPKELLDPTYVRLATLLRVLLPTVVNSTVWSHELADTWIPLRLVVLVLAVSIGACIEAWALLWSCLISRHESGCGVLILVGLSLMVRGCVLLQVVDVPPIVASRRIVELHGILGDAVLAKFGVLVR